MIPPKKDRYDALRNPRRANLLQVYDALCVASEGEGVDCASLPSIVEALELRTGRVASPPRVLDALQVLLAHNLAETSGRMTGLRGRPYVFSPKPFTGFVPTPVKKGTRS